MRGRSKILVSVAVFALLGILLGRHFFQGDHATRARALDHREQALEVLGAYVAEHVPQANVLVIGNPFSQRKGQPAEVGAFEQAAMRGLKAGCRGRVRSLDKDYPRLAAAAERDPSSIPLPPDTTTPLSYMMAEDAWDELFARHPGTDVFVSLVGVPPNLASQPLWQQPRPRWAFLLPDLRLLGESQVIREAFLSGKILAAVLARPGAPPERGRDGEEARGGFDRRFILVDAGNVDEVMQVLPALF